MIDEGTSIDRFKKPNLASHGRSGFCILYSVYLWWLLTKALDGIGGERSWWLACRFGGGGGGARAISYLFVHRCYFCRSAVFRVSADAIFEAKIIYKRNSKSTACNKILFKELGGGDRLRCVDENEAASEYQSGIAMGVGQQSLPCQLIYY
jgi:hypothetical protein